VFGLRKSNGFLQDHPKDDRLAYTMRASELWTVLYGLGPPWGHMFE